MSARRAILAAFVAACGQTAPAPKIQARASATASASSAPIVAVVEPAPLCWASGPIGLAGTGDPVATPVSSTKYPLTFAPIGDKERERRVGALHARHPSFDFDIDDFGVVTSAKLLATNRLPCPVKKELETIHYLSNDTVSVVADWLAALAAEMPDVPYLQGYSVQGVIEHGALTGVLLRQSKPVAEVLVHDLARTELDDDALIAKWSGSRVQWFRPFKHTKITPVRNFRCVPPPGGGCDPPGPRVEETIEMRLRGERPISKRYVESIERTSDVTRTGTSLVIRRSALLHIDDGKLGDDLFGKPNVEAEFGVELRVTGTDRRDAVTGEALPPQPR